MTKRKRSEPVVEERQADKQKGSLPDHPVQSGDLQGLSDEAEADSESVAELASEEQAFEAEAIDAVENTPDADVSEVKTKQVPEDDVPDEYRNQD
ncbi:MAG TPA: hypothetical protein VG675_04865 [Bryobacteraceae bacterium]|nr:hypothetical protein [Bryobacteraceae bacterium]